MSINIVDWCCVLHNPPHPGDFIREVYLEQLR